MGLTTFKRVRHRLVAIGYVDHVVDPTGALYSISKTGKNALRVHRVHLGSTQEMDPGSFGSIWGGTPIRGAPNGTEPDPEPDPGRDGDLP